MGGMTKDILSKVRQIFQTDMVDYVYVRISGRLSSMDSSIVLTGSDGKNFSVKRGPMLEKPDLVTIDSEIGGKRTEKVEFADLLGKEVTVNCYLDKNGEWKAMDMSAKVVINKEAKDVEDKT